MRTRENYILSFLLIAFVVIYSCSKHSGGGTGNTDDNSITYDISAEIFPNPERGFIHTYDVHSVGTGLNLAQLKLLRGENISLILRVFYLEDFKTQALSANELSLIQSDIDKVREAGL